MIEIEFYGRERRRSEWPEKVIDTWREYHDHLSVQGGAENLDPAQFAIWLDKSGVLLVELLFAMSRCLGYKFDKVQLKSGSYTPQAYGNVEQANNLMRLGIVKILAGEEGLPVRTLYSKEESKDNALVRKALIELLDSSRLVRRTTKPTMKKKPTTKKKP